MESYNYNITGLTGNARKYTMECMQRSIRIADSIMDGLISCQLLIEILNQCIYFNTKALSDGVFSEVVAPLTTLKVISQSKSLPTNLPNSSLRFNVPSNGQKPAFEKPFVTPPPGLDSTAYDGFNKGFIPNNAYSGFNDYGVPPQASPFYFHSHMYPIMGNQRIPFQPPFMAFSPASNVPSFIPPFHQPSDDNISQGMDSTTYNGSHATMPKMSQFSAGNRLMPISNESEFNGWIKTFIKYLRHQNLGHVIPDRLGNTGNIKEPEKDFIIEAFNYCVPSTAYPKWFQFALTNEYIELIDVIGRAMSLAEDKAGVDEIYEQLLAVKYDGKSDAILFKKLLNSLIAKGEKVGIHIPNEVLCQRIASNLTDSYRPIADFYRMNYGNVSLEDLLVNYRYLSSRV
ncbi:uncharacterized protein NDAI_0G00610 [Naumovozyma dairenensis CBS 421]|uniref:Uncharacterized protein n=1 Tax=Naumovozyma dairenensis (strain ATCC 10597 / BCRC 20456 / CBS 421 / NBRC 0211 / NRRL Y-12639) TaxID=1071378 RepID=G0WDH6_NAUDC|nr:hypothetical protein NDAI_0G00610 [Naumovozyma dairenensis CBS 421]CCD25837.2 hypothetical protein NDAI_0G00610 [Naumovozyma dairenensis CBS 421]